MWSGLGGACSYINSLVDTSKKDQCGRVEGGGGGRGGEGGEVLC